MGSLQFTRYCGKNLIENCLHFVEKYEEHCLAEEIQEIERFFRIIMS